MAYTNEGNAGFRITGVTVLGSAIAGPTHVSLEKEVVREAIKAMPNNVPISRPVDAIDGRLTVETLDLSADVDETTAAGNVVTNFSEANGSGSGSLTIGKMVAGSVRHTYDRNTGGFRMQQDFALEGALTFTPAV